MRPQYTIEIRLIRVVRRDKGAPAEFNVMYRHYFGARSTKKEAETLFSIAESAAEQVDRHMVDLSKPVFLRQFGQKER